MDSKDDRQVDLKDLFCGLQSQMVGKLSTNRKFITHPGYIGDSLENAWIEWLREYLPNRYSIEKAIVIDHTGKTSHQIDVVIYDNWYTPFIFNQNGFKYIPAEGVYAVFEVKPEISKHNIEYAGDKIASVRELERTSTDMISCGQKQRARSKSKIVGGLLCTSLKTNGKSWQRTTSNNLRNLKGFRSLDIGCIADTSSFIVNYDNEWDNETGEEKEFETFYHERVFKEPIYSSPGNSLITFLLGLSHLLQQRIGTVPAIDYQAYLKAIDAKLD